MSVLAALSSRYRRVREEIKERISPPVGYCSGERFPTSLCKFLQSREEIDACAAFLRRPRLRPHNVSCKAWDLALILPELGPGNFFRHGQLRFLHLEKSGSQENRWRSLWHRLASPGCASKGRKLFDRRLDGHGTTEQFFDHITRLSVIEHQVDFTRFAREAARLLVPKGRLCHVRLLGAEGGSLLSASTVWIGSHWTAR